MSISSSLGEQHEVTLPQGVIRYRERGSGPPVVFIHGVLVNADLWRKVVPLIEGDCRCLCPDMPLGAHLPGMDPQANLSMYGIADLIRNFLDGVEVERATFVGNDSGGAIVQIFAARYPERVERLVLTNCDINEHFPPTKVLKILMSLGRIPGFTPATVSLIAQSLRSKRMRRLVARSVIGDETQIDDEVFASYAGPLQSNRGTRRDLGKAVSGMNKRYTLEATERLKDCDFPILLAWGEEDRIFFPVQYAERLAEQLPTATLKLIPRAKTFVSEDAPAELAELIREQVAQRAPTT